MSSLRISDFLSAAASGLQTFQLSVSRGIKLEKPELDRPFCKSSMVV